MEKREKIIVGLMIAAVLYGAYSLFFESMLAKKKGPAVGTSNAQLGEFVSQISQQFAGTGQTETGAYALERAESGWDNNPFLESEFELNPKEDKDEISANDIETAFRYSGYLKMGKRGMAIINDIEYEEGEMLEVAGHLVKKITPTQVVLGIKGREEDVVLVITEME